VEFFFEEFLINFFLFVDDEGRFYKGFHFEAVSL